jgi:hypothetical protein
MADVALIVGNGFDIDMGLPSRYSDFIRSKEWNDAVSGFNIYLQQKDYQNHSLIAQLQMASTNSQWFDIEEEIHKFIENHSNLKDLEVRDIRSEFDAIKVALTNYLKRITSTFTADNSKVSTALHYRMRECPLTVTEIYFNYTYPHQYIKLPIQPEIFNGAQHWVTFVHGSLRDNDIVLGCDLQEGEQVNRQLSFMYKYNQLKKANHIARNILEAKEIIFFGHSINEMDFGYFKEFFKVASASPIPIRHLTIITYDDESERNIKDNIRNQGISVSDLYSNLWTFDIIKTSKLYDNNAEEGKKWSEFLERLLTKDRHGIKI